MILIELGLCWFFKPFEMSDFTQYGSSNVSLTVSVTFDVSIKKFL